jgi:hypothetical protein
MGAARVYSDTMSEPDLRMPDLQSYTNRLVCTYLLVGSCLPIGR